MVKKNDLSLQTDYLHCKPQQTPPMTYYYITYQDGYGELQGRSYNDEYDYSKSGFAHSEYNDYEDEFDDLARYVIEAIKKEKDV